MQIKVLALNFVSLEQMYLSKAKIIWMLQECLEQFIVDVATNYIKKIIASFAVCVSKEKTFKWREIAMLPPYN